MTQFAYAAMVTVVLAGCALTPPSNVHQPMSVRPHPTLARVEENGAIYQPQRPLRLWFEDRHARSVGDLLTVSIVEKNSASKKAATSADHKGSMDLSVPTVTGLPGKFMQGAGVTASSANKYEGSGGASSNNDFSGTITVTVIEVMSNGNLVVSGEKQVSINQGSEFIRFSGVVNPDTVSAANEVKSTQVADARIEYLGNGHVAEAQNMGWLGRFFLSVSPF